MDIAYDAGGRRSSVTAPVGAWRRSYDDETGQLTGLTAPGGQALAFEHDGPLLTASEWSGSVSGRVEYDYDADFRVTRQRVNGVAVDYAYDADSLLTQAGALTLSRASDHAGVTGTALGGVTSSRAYGGFGELAERSVDNAGAEVYRSRYGRDAAGRITTERETVQGESTDFSYTYDAVGRLTAVAANGTPIHTYAYGPNGNRLSHTGPGGTETADYDDQDRLIRYGDTTYAYNEAGDLQEKAGLTGTTTYDYDVFGNLRTVEQPDGTTIGYIIDGQNRRVGKTIDGELEKGWLYQDGLNPVAQTDGEGNVTHRFVYGDKANVPAYMVKTDPDTGEETTYRIVSDHLGSVRLVIDTQTGGSAQRIDYSPFGEETANTDPGFQPFGFAGGLTDQQTGLVRFGARDYHPGMGRWTAKDPIGFNGGTTNLYGYAINDPVNFVDPNGKFFNVATGLIGAAVGAGVAAATGGSVVQGALSGATAGFSFGIGLAAPVGTGAAFGAATNAYDRCGNFSGMQALTGGLTGALGGALGRIAGIGNGVAAARRGVTNAVQRAHRAQAAVEAGAAGAAQQAVTP